MKTRAKPAQKVAQKAELGGGQRRLKTGHPRVRACVCARDNCGRSDWSGARHAYARAYARGTIVGGLYVVRAREAASAVCDGEGGELVLWWEPGGEDPGGESVEPLGCAFLGG